LVPTHQGIGAPARPMYLLGTDDWDPSEVLAALVCPPSFARSLRSLRSLLFETPSPTRLHAASAPLRIASAASACEAASAHGLRSGLADE